MKIKIGVVMDPIGAVHYKKDSTLALLWEASKRGWDIFYMEQRDIFLRDGAVFANAKILKVRRDENSWFDFLEQRSIPLNSLHVILMRKDPPFNLEYIYTTYLLEQAEQQGVLVINKPQSLRDANEKMVTTWFKTCCPPTLITCDIHLLRDFWREHQDIVCKPLDAMGGASVFRVKFPDENASVIFETLTQQETTLMVAQRYIPEIKQGDKRIILIDGEPMPYALARVPKAGELRGNLSAGATGIAQPLTKRDHFICKETGPYLREKGLIFVGLDVIGDYLTEINVTSPTGVRELDEQTGSHTCEKLFNYIERQLNFS